MAKKREDAQGQPDRTVLPLPEPQHPAITEVDARKATPPPRFELKPPKGAGAPNVVFILMDNFGFGDPGCFGGPVNMPAFQRLAKSGLQTNMHTAPVCSPTRVALLTGRNSHSANMGGVAEMGTAFPGMNCVRPQSVAPLAEIMRLNGYGTAMFGKSHELPPWELSVSGPMDRWPAHSGFDKFYGFLQGESDLYSPALYDGVTRIPTPRDPDYHVSTDITDKAIVWVRSQQSLTPDKPFFIATTLHKAFWEAAPRAAFDNDTWELYNAEEDFSLTNDLAAKYPEKVEALKALFMTEAVKYHVLPLDDRVLERFNASIAGRPDLMGPRTSLTLYEGMIGLSENAFINMKNRSYTITAELDIPNSGAEGVIIAHGGHTGGWSLYVHKGQPKFAYNWFGRELYEVSAPKALLPGTVTLRWEFIYDGGKAPGAGGRGDLFINGEQAASGRINRTIPFFIGTETADVGMDDLTPVTHDYKAYDNAFTGNIRKIVIGVGPVGEAFDPPIEWNGVG